MEKFFFEWGAFQQLTLPSRFFLIRTQRNLIHHLLIVRNFIVWIKLVRGSFLGAKLALGIQIITLNFSNDLVYFLLSRGLLYWGLLLVTWCAVEIRACEIKAILVDVRLNFILEVIWVSEFTFEVLLVLS